MYDHKINFGFKLQRREVRSTTFQIQTVMCNLKQIV